MYKTQLDKALDSLYLGTCIDGITIIGAENPEYQGEYDLVVTRRNGFCVIRIPISWSTTIKEYLVGIIDSVLERIDYCVSIYMYHDVALRLLENGSLSIRELIDRLPYNRSQLARKLGVDVRYVAHLYKDIDCKMSTFTRIREKIGVLPYELLHGGTVNE